MAKKDEVTQIKRKKVKNPTRAQIANQIPKAERLAVVGRMRGRGCTLKEIAAECGVSIPQIHRDVEEILDTLALSSMTELRKYRSQMVLQRAAMIEAHLPRALDPEAEGFEKSAAIVDKNQSAIAKLYGLEAPQVVHQLIEQVEPGDEIARGNGIVIEVAGEGEVDWAQIRANAEQQRSAINYVVEEGEDADSED